MDGAHEDVFKRGWTPFITSLLEKQTSLELTNDLLSRGWLEIATGKHASITGAMYDMPKVNGTVEWKNEFSINEIPGLGSSVKPIWQELSERGVKVGVMNLPTTYPAPEVNGFFVSGGGGGAPVTEAPTEELCTPKHIHKKLLDSGYIVDDRLYQLMVEKGLAKPDKIFERLSYKNKKRTEGFLELDKEFSVDFGFIVYRTSSVLAEQILNAEYCRRENPRNQPDVELEDAIKSYYGEFDKEIEKLAEMYSGAELVFVSDHGISKREFSVNINTFLRKEGFQKINYVETGKKLIVENLKKIIPFSIKHLLKKSNAKVIKSAKHVGSVGYDKSLTKAFMKSVNCWTHGIYINDKKRFGGPVSESDIASVKLQIIESLNLSELVKKHGFEVAADEVGAVEFYPDIVLKVPDGYLTTDKTNSFVEEYRSPKSISALDLIKKGEILSIKSRAPMGHVASDKSDLEVYKGGNLTKIYEYILSRFE